MDAQFWLRVFGLIVVTAPSVLVAIYGVATLLGDSLSERVIARCSQGAIWSGLIAAIAVLAIMLGTGELHALAAAGDWVAIPEYHFGVKFVFDRLSVPFVILSFLLCGTVSGFASRYMHRERGFGRFFTLFSLFLLGMTITSLAGTVETLFVGWELVGLSSAMLVAFYHERSAPVRNGLHVWTVYRVSDAALLLASIVLHHVHGHGDFDQLMGPVSWPDGHANITPWQSFLVGSLLMAAAMGKSALLPFSGWLPRAMEGPTPSSAVFYGALSVHLGAFLMLRFSPVIGESPTVMTALIVLGLATAVYAVLEERVQTDIKSVLTYSSLSQVGLIIAEIGLTRWLPWMQYVVLVHILGHACWRTLQFLRAPTLLHDYRLIENATGDRVNSALSNRKIESLEQFAISAYSIFLLRHRLDGWLIRRLVMPVLSAFTWCSETEDRMRASFNSPEADVDRSPV